MAELDLLLRAYESHVSTPWRDGLSGSERVWFLVYSPINERRLRRRIEEFAIATDAAGHGWLHIDLTDAFPRWLASQRHVEGYFKRPGGVPEQRFVEAVCASLRSTLETRGENDVVALTGAGSFFGITRLSGVIKSIDSSIRGRLLVGFPGVREGNVYKMFDSGDGWDYLAVPITARYEEAR